MSNDIYKVLKDLNINYQKIDHPAVFTTQEADQYQLEEGTCHSKNLFLRNKKKTNYYLVVMEADKKFDIKSFSEKLGEKKLSFASPEDLMKYLHVTPGSVSPFTLINNKEKNVTVFIDQDLMDYKQAGFHPNINTATLVINTDDFKRYLSWTNNKIIYQKL
ncbi:MAG: prolyl-tRNA synthetase associated domain-containing protein [Candidatus Pacebacteria bacterium]|nr:prolyl-tRNA synthetase associated domain-containing protein [Candidatus Paceibacterota bacterium]